MLAYCSKIIFIISILLLSSCTPKQEMDKLISLNLIDRDGLSENITSSERLKKYENADFMSSQPYQKVLRVYSRNTKGETPAFVTSYHPNGQIHQYLEVLNGRALGCYKEWFANGQQKIEANVIGGEADITTVAEKSWLFDGLSFVWDEQGDLQAEIPYNKGILEGISTYYHSNGKISKTVPFTDNQINGTYTLYSPEGGLLMTAEFANGVQDGPTTEYHANGLISVEEMFCEGFLLEGRYFNLEGILVSEIKEGMGYRTLFKDNGLDETQEFRHGQLEGQIQVFNPKGQLIKTYGIKEGLKQGEELDYYTSYKKSPKLIPKISINWFDNKIQGLVKTWYENGIQESQREMSQNAKNGVATAWYRDGSLMLIEEYDHNKLMRGEYYRKGEKIPVSLVNKGKGVVTLFDADGNFVRKVNYISGMPLD